MLVKPKQWISHMEGGYLYSKGKFCSRLHLHKSLISCTFSVAVMRYKESVEQAAYLRRAADLGHVELVFASLDVLGGTPWKINAPIFDVVLKVWNSGARMPKIPPAVYDQPEPERPPNYDIDQKAKLVYLTRQKMYTSEKANNHSERCSVNYKVEIARTVCSSVLHCLSYIL